LQNEGMTIYAHTRRRPDWSTDYFRTRTTCVSASASVGHSSRSRGAHGRTLFPLCASAFGDWEVQTGRATWSARPWLGASSARWAAPDSSLQWRKANPRAASRSRLFRKFQLTAADVWHSLPHASRRCFP
jgi:hypothetical protein